MPLTLSQIIVLLILFFLFIFILNIMITHKVYDIISQIFSEGIEIELKDDKEN